MHGVATHTPAAIDGTQVLTGIQDLLDDPNLSDPAQSEPYQLALNNPELCVWLGVWLGVLSLVARIGTVPHSHWYGRVRSQVHNGDPEAGSAVRSRCIDVHAAAVAGRAVASGPASKPGSGGRCQADDN